jgi:alkylhydroperoxidase family enzyme
MDANAAGSSRAGASKEKIAAIAEFAASDLYTKAEKAALAVAEGMTRTPADVSETEFAEARGHFSEEQMVELVATIAMENYRARFNRAFLVESLGRYEAMQ